MIFTASSIPLIMPFSRVRSTITLAEKNGIYKCGTFASRADTDHAALPDRVRQTRPDLFQLCVAPDEIVKISNKCPAPYL